MLKYIPRMLRSGLPETWREIPTRTKKKRNANVLGAIGIKKKKMELIEFVRIIAN